jgi:hypothetical protein
MFILKDDDSLYLVTLTNSLIEICKAKTLNKFES